MTLFSISSLSTPSFLPLLIRSLPLRSLVQDVDLWRNALPGSSAFHAGLAALKLEYDANANPGIFDALAALDPDAVIAAGAEALAARERLVAAALATAHEVQLGGPAGAAAGWGRCLAVCGGPEIGAERSALGNALAAASAARGLRPCGAVAYTEPGMGEAAATRLKLSLRSTGPEDDTTVVTQRYGGGGHLNASSCLLDRSEFDRWRVGSEQQQQ